jgi:hypothetical protein
MSDGVTSDLLGFLTIIPHDLHGLFGGYLLLNSAGRPLEFHCTVPIKPNRAQQILYGPTLEPYLYGEQIGATLVKAAQQSPLVVLVEQPVALAVRQHVDLPAALVVPQSAPDDHNNCDELIIGQNRLSVPARYKADRCLIAQRLAVCDEWFDFSEPFNRIRTAIEEAQRTTSKAA